MFKGHPKGLFVLFFSNMGERFGYYTILAILMLYIQANYGLSAEEAGVIYSVYLFGIYFIPLLGGILADKMGYGKVVTLGIILMFLGYGLLAIPGTTLPIVVTFLMIVAVGTGFFKGNLVVLLGNLYEDERYKSVHSAAFSIFYMGINIGAFYAPHAATGIRNWILGLSDFTYDKAIPGLAHKYLDGTLENTGALVQAAKEQLGNIAMTPEVLTNFCNDYITAIGQAYNGAFAIASASVIISLIIFKVFQKHYKFADKTQKQKIASGEKDSLTPEQTRSRLIALGLVFLVVIFFWLAFHQNGYTFTFFARDYTVSEVSRGGYAFFDLLFIHGLAGFIMGLIFLFNKKNSNALRIGGAIITVIGGALAYFRYVGFPETGNEISPELFQHFNPFFIVFLTPVIVAFFAWLNKRNKEPNAPAKIGIGMALTGGAYLILVFASLGLPAPFELNGGVSPDQVSPYPLIGLYFSITIAELFLSPMGLAFVAKVSPPKYKGMMQGGWLAATAVGNLLSGYPAGFLWERLELWQTFLVLGGLAFMASFIIAAVYKRLKKATEDSGA